MESQKGSTLIVSLVLLTIITVVAVYSIEGSNIQSKMVANSLFSTLTYQECRNEQEANVRLYNRESAAREILLGIITNELINSIAPDSITKQRIAYQPKSEDIDLNWSYIGEAAVGPPGYDNSNTSNIAWQTFQLDCTAKYNYSTNSQSLGVVVESLKNPDIK